MEKVKKKNRIFGGVYQDKDGWWHYYFGGVVSGNHPNKTSASLGLDAEFNQAVQQFGEDWEIKLERKDF